MRLYQWFISLELELRLPYATSREVVRNTDALCSYVMINIIIIRYVTTLRDIIDTEKDLIYIIDVAIKSEHCGVMQFFDLVTKIHR